MFTKSVTHIIAPPPTPNGDLHLGHLSGPYLGADIYSRCLRQAGGRTSYVTSTDDHQTYVDTTAQRLGTTPEQLIQTSREEIGASLRAYSIVLAHFGQIDAEYTSFVEGFFRTLFEQGMIEVRTMPVLYDPAQQRYAVEAFISGICSRCLAPSAGGICEACGHPNGCLDLLGVATAGLDVRYEPRLVLDLARYQTTIAARLRAMSPHRPWLARLSATLLERELQPFVLSYKTKRGIDVSFAGLEEQKLNVWGEMFPGHMYHLSVAAGGLSADDRYVQFFGFDNSYFYAFVHVALSIAAHEAGYAWPQPSAFITNQFFNLDNAKFSTSKGHLVWARELAAEFNSDLIRFFLALHGPEYQETNFSREAFETEVQQLATEINRAVWRYNAAVTTPRDTGVDDSSQAAFAASLAFSARPQLDLALYSSSDAARRARNCIRVMGNPAIVNHAGFTPYIPSLLALCLEPFCPRYAAALRATAGVDRVTWDELAKASRITRLAPIESGVTAHVGVNDTNPLTDTRSVRL